MLCEVKCFAWQDNVGSGRSLSWFNLACFLMICKKGQKKHLIKFTDDAKLGDVKNIQWEQLFKEVRNMWKKLQNDI